MARKKGKIKNWLNKQKDKIKTVVKDPKQALKGAKFLPLLPFKNMMVTVLKKKGEPVTLETPLEKVAQLFYDRIVLKKTTVSYESYQSLENLDPVTIGVIVSAILGFIKKKQEEKEEGKKLSEEDEIVLEGSKIAADNIEKESEKTEGGNWFEENKTIILLVAGAVVLFFVLKKK